MIPRYRAYTTGKTGVPFAEIREVEEDHGLVMNLILEL